MGICRGSKAHLMKYLSGKITQHKTSIVKIVQFEDGDQGLNIGRGSVTLQLYRVNTPDLVSTGCISAILTQQTVDMAFYGDQWHLVCSDDDGRYILLHSSVKLDPPIKQLIHMAGEDHLVEDKTYQKIRKILREAE